MHLTDGFCLLKNSRVVLNHYDIDYYDYSAHLIYLKDPEAFEEKFQVMGPAAVYADSTRIYDLSIVSLAASYIPYLTNLELLRPSPRPPYFYVSFQCL